MFNFLSPGPPHPFLQHCIPAGWHTIYIGTQNCFSPSAGLHISTCWTPWAPCQPISSACQGPSAWQHDRDLHASATSLILHWHWQVLLPDRTSTAEQTNFSSSQQISRTLDNFASPYRLYHTELFNTSFVQEYLSEPPPSLRLASSQGAYEFHQKLTYFSLAHVSNSFVISHWSASSQTFAHLNRAHANARFSLWRYLYWKKQIC